MIIIASIADFTSFIISSLHIMEATDDTGFSRSQVAAACSEGDYDRVQELLAAGADPVTSRSGYFNWSPLHYTARQGRLDFAKILIMQYDCHPMVEDKEGRTPLHVACQHGHLDFACYLIRQKCCDVQYGDIENLIPLYHACGWLSECTSEQALIISKFLVSSAMCDPNMRDTNGKNGVLHASEKGFLSVLKYFVEQCNCDILAVDYRENNALHLAVSFSNDLDVVNYIVGLQKLDLSSVNNKSNNILHMAAIANSSLDICKLILKSADLGMFESLMEARNCRDATPLDLARPELLSFLLSRYTVKNSHFYDKYALSLGMKQPQVPHVRIFFVGDTSAGKSTLIRSLQKESSSFSSSFSLSFTSHSQPSSPVIIEQAHVVAVTEFKSKFYGEVQFYDLDGSSESQYIHETMMPHLILPHLSLFLMVLDFSRPIKEISASFHHWLDVLQRALKGRLKEPKLLIVGSHSDVVKSDGRPNETRSPREKLKHLNFKTDSSAGFEVVAKVLVDCQKNESSGINMVRKQLSTLCEQINDNSELPFNACCLLMHIKSSYSSSSVVSLKTIVADMTSYDIDNVVVYDVRYFLSDDPHVLVSLLDLLNKSGHLFFLKNEADPSRSLIIPDVSRLCSELAQSTNNCELNPLALRNNHHNLFALSNIERLFPDHDPLDMLYLLSHLKLTVSEDNISTQLTMISTELEMYYCPSFLTNPPPNDVWDTKSQYEFTFGWRLEASQHDHHFSLHFIHTLLIQLFSIVITSTKVGHFSLWRCGLYFECDLNGMEILVDASDDSKAVSLIMRSKECTTSCIKYRSVITKRVRDTFKEYYSHFEPVELIMDPFYSRQYPLLPRKSLTLFNSRQVLKNTRNGNMVVKSTDNVLMSIKELLVVEPYVVIGRDCLSDLLKVKRTDIVTDIFLRNLVERITENNADKVVGIFAAMFGMDKGKPVTVESLRLNSDQTYQNIIQSLNNFTTLDSSMFPL